MNELKIFKSEEFGQIRTVTKDNEPWFVASDIAKALGYRMASDLVRRIDEDDKGTHIMSTHGGEQAMLIINESGFYSSILGSKLESAKRFKHWVTSEVLPSIRKTGGYIAGQENMSDTELMAKALLVAQKQIEQRNAQIEQMAPKALFADAVSSSKTSILVGDMAKMLKQNGIDIGQKRLFKWLRDNGYLIKQHGVSWNMPTQRSMEAGLFEVKETTITHSDGHVSISKTVKVSGKGQIFFINKFLNASEGR